MTRIAFVGAGSTVFAQTLLNDILSFPELAGCTISLFDIDNERLHTSEIVAHKIAATSGANPTIEATTDRRRALDGAKYVITMFQIGGYKPATLTDFDIPKKYGLRQTIGDTLGIGGIMRALRTIPVLLDLCHDMEDLCPEALHLNYANPMAMNVWAMTRASKVRTVGLCHSVQNTAEQLAVDIRVPVEEIDFTCAGINHLAFYLRFERTKPDGNQDLYPLIQKRIDEERIPKWNRVRYDVFSRLGYFVTESSEHFAEYVPWYIKRDRPDLIDRYNIPLDEYLQRCEAQIAQWEDLRRTLEDPDASIPIWHSNEYAPLIIHGIETNTPRTVYGNVPNHGWIDNLPEGCAVEVPCTVDGAGIHPQPVGNLPPQLAALIMTNVNVQSLTVEAALTGRRDHVYHAAMFDPHTAAELDPDQIRALVDELLDAHANWLPEYV